jgi:hypothetical protein
MRIDNPPFLAYTVTGGITFTFGGLEINPDAQVLSTSGNPIKGLYASGDIVGLFFHNYPSPVRRATPFSPAWPDVLQLGRLRKLDTRGHQAEDKQLGRENSVKSSSTALDVRNRKIETR